MQGRGGEEKENEEQGQGLRVDGVRRMRGVILAGFERHKVFLLFHLSPPGKTCGRGGRERESSPFSLFSLSHHDVPAFVTDRVPCLLVASKRTAHYEKVEEDLSLSPHPPPSLTETYYYPSHITNQVVSPPYNGYRARNSIMVYPTICDHPL